MVYINTQTGEFPLSEWDIKKQFQNTSFPKQFVPPEGFASVLLHEPPVFDRLTHTAIQAEPVEVNGEWVRGWNVVERSDADKAKSDEATSRATRAFNLAVSAGYTNADGITMQADKRDYEMMRDGLAVALAAPVEYGGANGDLQALTTVRDKDNNGHVMTIEAAQALATEMMQNYWLLWSKKGVYRDALMGCNSTEEMDAVQF